MYFLIIQRKYTLLFLPIREPSDGSSDFSAVDDSEEGSGKGYEEGFKGISSIHLVSLSKGTTEPSPVVPHLLPLSEGATEPSPWYPGRRHHRTVPVIPGSVFPVSSPVLPAHRKLTPDHPGFSCPGNSIAFIMDSEFTGRAPQRHLLRSGLNRQSVFHQRSRRSFTTANGILPERSPDENDENQMAGSSDRANPGCRQSGSCPRRRCSRGAAAGSFSCRRKQKMPEKMSISRIMDSRLILLLIRMI